MTLGDPSIVALDFRTITGRSPDLIWGSGTLIVHGSEFWFQADGDAPPSPILWSWSDLLSWLGRHWTALKGEENVPVPHTILRPGNLRARCEEEWRFLADEDEIERQDLALFRFEQRHDMARALPGITLPSVHILRQGALAWVDAPGSAKLHAWADVERALVAIGDGLARLVEAHMPDHELVRAWRGREEASTKAAMYRTGATRERFDRIVDRYGAAAVRGGEVLAESVFLAAARMTAALPWEMQQRVLDEVSRIGASSTSRLDRESAAARRVKQGPDTDFEHGYRLALWLRERLNNKTGPLDVEALPHHWGVAVRDVEIPAPGLEAIAAWGVDRGPAILLNRAGSRVRGSNGRRMVLAHEVCHLLVDRSGALPAAEVLGGLSPSAPERRANAFAAELLLPRREAAKVMRDLDGNVAQALDALCERFGVSREVAAWQIRNGAGIQTVRTAPDQALLDNLTVNRRDAA